MSAPSTTNSHTPEASAGRASTRVLLVEDDPADAALLRSALSGGKTDFEIVMLSSLREAEENLEKRSFDVALLDLTLPDSNAKNTLERLATIGARVATIVLTGSDDEETCSQLVGSGAQDYIPKNELLSRQISRDIEHAIERFRTASELAEERQNALAASVAKSNFVSAMSHEIRTPLNALLGMADLLSESKLDDQQREYVRVFHRAGHALLSLINNVLDLASIERGKLDLVIAPFALRELVEETAETFAFEAHKKGLALTVEIDHDVPEIVEGDGERLRQVLSNLLGNAIKFTPEGRVAMRLRRDDVAGLAFEVEDSGIGIDSKKLKAIFEPFEQAEHDPGHVYGGTGLGLSLCRELVERMGGAIRAERADGGGSIFRMEIPLRSTRDFVESPVLARRTRVMLALASEPERRAVERFCTRAGAEVDSAGSCEEALELIANASEPYDLVAADCRLPQNGGLPVVEKSVARNDAVRTVLLLPMDHRPGDMKLCRDRGIDSMIKPVRERRLRDWLSAPLSAAEGDSSTSRGAEGAMPLRGLRILHADDSADNRLLVNAYLRDAGCEVSEVADGVEAVAAFAAGDFDAVLIDVMMPRMDGLEATRRIRELEQREGRKKIPILALTANAFLEQAERCFEAGADLHLPKPLSRQALLGGLSSQLDLDSDLDPAKELTDESEPDMTDSIDLSEIEEEIADLVPGYLARRCDEVRELQTLLGSSDSEGLRTIGHNLKGTGGGYGLPRLSELGSELEEAAKAGDLKAAGAAIDEIERFVELAQEAVAQSGLGQGSA